MFDLKLFFQESKPLYVQVSDAIADSITTEKLKAGHRVPSINQLSEEYLLSRDTVEKAYKDLMKKGIIHSVIGKGYYVHRTDIEKKLRVLVIFNKLSNYKRQIYNAIIDTLGDGTAIDLSIHHSNARILSNIINNNLTMYDYYVIAPHFYVDSEVAFDAIKQLPKDRVILLDRFLAELDEYACVYQDYEKDIFQALMDGLGVIKKYDKLILVFPAISKYPPEIARGFKLFCCCKMFEYEIRRGIEPFQMVKNGEMYVVIEEADLANLIKICKQTEMEVGKDIGIISYNDTPLKEILLDGITVMSTDHDLMGRTAARLILDKQFKRVKNPFSLIMRKSL